MKKTILSGAFVIACAFVQAQQTATPAASPATVAPAQDAPKPQPTAEELKNMPDMKFDSDTFNFGTIKQGDAVSFEFKFVNVGKEPLVISSAHGSCGCTVPDWPKNPIKKSEKSSIKVTFNSAGKQGDQIKTVTVNSNAKQNPKILYLKGKVDKPADPVPAATPATTAPTQK